jgi:protein-S-isoprenylcysteine O-methyltransferase Ste14
VRLSIAGAWVIALRSATQLTSATIRTHRDLVFILALVVLWTGIGLRLWAFRTLGRYFTFLVMTSADQPVVSDGPYRIIRHPGYAGGALALIGLGLAMSNWVSLIALTAIPPLGYVRRIRVEEAALDATLGERYRGYAQGRKRLVPFVW